MDKNNVKMNRIAHSSGFTLAEVLITLSILGVVAAISIPNMVQQYQKRITITKLQKAYANLEQAAQNLAISTGCIGRDFECTGLYNITNDDEFAKEFFNRSGLNIRKEGRFLPSARGAAALSCKNSGSSCNGTNGFLYNIDLYITKDNLGYSVLKQNIRTFDKWGYFPNWTRKQEFKSGMLIYVFTDPIKVKKKIKSKLNSIMGIDTFLFVLYDNFQIEPATFSSDGKYSPISKSSVKNCNKNDNGLDCAAKIIQDGWKITYW